MSHHFWSPRGVIGGVIWGCPGCSGTTPRYEPGTVTVGLLYLGPTVQPAVRRTALSKTTQYFILITLHWRDFGGSEQLALPACTGPLLDQTEDGRNEEDTDDAGGQHPSNDGATHDLAGHGSGPGSRPKRD